jgi:hypothetical protein
LLWGSPANFLDAPPATDHSTGVRSNNSRNADGGKLLAARSAALLKRMNDVDLSKLTDDERELLEKLIAKAEGRFLGKIIPAFIVEFVDAGQNMIESRGTTEEK